MYPRIKIQNSGSGGLFVLFLANFSIDVVESSKSKSESKLRGSSSTDFQFKSK